MFLTKIWNSYKNAYGSLPKVSWQLAFIELINRSGFMVIFFLNLYLTDILHYTPTQGGQIIASYGFGAILGSYWGGKLSDKFGAFLMIKISLLLNGLIFIIMGQFTNLIFLFIISFLLGIISSALYPANGTALSQTCPPHLRTQGFSLQRLASNLGITIGPALGGFLALIDYKLLFWVDGATCILAFFLACYFFKTNRPTDVSIEEPLTTNKSPWKNRLFIKILVFNFFSSIIFLQLFSTFPLYLKSIYTLKENLIGILLSINTLIILFFEMILINALKGNDKRKTVAWGFLLSAEGFALMAWGKGFVFAIITVVIWTIGEMITMPTMSSLVADLSSPKEMGRYMGLYSLSFSWALLVAPWIGTTLYEKISPHTIWHISGLMGIILFFGFRGFKKPTQS